jgi:prepilin-type N-terminal cleavage/methylation domain-containing protein
VVEIEVTAARPQISASSRGFTLIEMMVAVAILGLVMVMLYEGFHSVAGSKVHAENRLAVDQAARTILWQMGNELRGAVQTAIAPSRVMLVGEARMAGGHPIDNLLFSTLDPGHRRTVEDFGPEEILSYTLTPDPAHRGWFILTRDQASGLLNEALPASHGPTGVVLANDVLSLHIRYFDGQSWSESWDSRSLPPGRALPREVSIDLQMAGAGGTPLTLSTVVTLPMALTRW